MNGDRFQRRTPPEDSRDSPTDRRGTDGSHAPCPEPSPLREAAIPWSAREVLVKRTETEIVRAYWWWRGEELITKLQWLVRGQDSQWHPMNTPVPPWEQSA